MQVLSFSSGKGAMPIVVKSRNEDGSGVIEVPILTVGKLDLALTAGGGEGTWDVTLDVLKECASNFSLHPGPVPITVDPHREFKETAGAMPGFVEALRCDEDREALMAELWLAAPLFYEVAAGFWRGFSVDAVRDAAWPSVTLAGWSVIGGVFTNRPAAPVEFRMPDTVAASAAARFSFGLEAEPEQETEKMDTKDVISLASHEAKVSEIRAQVELKAREIGELTTKLESAAVRSQALASELSESQAQLSTMRTERDTFRVGKERAENEARALRSQVEQVSLSLTEAKAKLDESETAMLARDVRDSVREAVSAGVPPALFDGFDVDPAAWMRARFASLETFKDHVSALRGVAPKLKGSALSSADPKPSGHDPAKSDPDPTDVKLTAEEIEQFRKLGIDPKFVGVTSEDEARKRIADAK